MAKKTQGEIFYQGYILKLEKSHKNKKIKANPEDISLGNLLRRTREERNIDLDEAVRVTRIRRHSLEALENEEWDKLPPQVFVKGFLRSYAEFLGLDKEMVLNSYLKTSPFQKYKPQALNEIKQRLGRWNLTIIIPVLALALIASIIYLKRNNISIVEKVFQYLETPTHIEEKGNTVEKEDNKSQGAKQKEGIFFKNEKPLPPRFLLAAKVNSRTWIAIYIDDEPVKEYLFQPGETMGWTANKGFEILVGNAGGIEFVLDGKAVGRLGPQGKVVRVRLPE